MENYTGREKFSKALGSILSNSPKGFKAALARACGLPATRLSDYIANRINTPEDKREMIANFLKTTTEEMMTLGKQLLSGVQEKNNNHDKWLNEIISIMVALPDESKDLIVREALREKEFASLKRKLKKAKS